MPCRAVIAIQDRHSAIDIGYSLYCIHMNGVGFKVGVEEAFGISSIPSSRHPVYMMIAEKEFAEQPAFLECIKFLGAVIQKHHYKNFRYEFRVLDDSYHVGSKPEGYTRGLKFVFEPMLQK